MAGRNTEKTKEVVAKLEEAAAVGASVEEMAFYANVHRVTLWRWMKDDEELRNRIEELWERPILEIRQNLVNEAKKNGELGLKVLERKRKNEFSPRTEHTGADGKDLIPLSEEDQKKLDHLIYGQPTEQPKPAGSQGTNEPASGSGGSAGGNSDSGGSTSTDPAVQPAEQTSTAPDPQPEPAHEPSTGGNANGNPGAETVPS